MKLKYYLRGLGIGIIVTAIIMGVAAKDKNVMTDEEIKARAMELGMIEQKVLSDISNTSAPIEEEQILQPPTQEPTKAPMTEQEELPGITNTPEPQETPEAQETPEPQVTPEPEKTPEPTQEPENEPQIEETVTLEIKSGETSWSISKALYEMGMVDSASSFDSFLCQNGYDKTIRIGKFVISKGATYEEIAKIIAR